MRVAAIVVFFVGLFPLSLWAEMVLVPMVVLAVGVSVVASERSEDAAAKRLVDSVLTAGGLALLGWATYRAIREWAIVDSADTVRALLLPIWATAAVVPVVYLFSVLIGYETVALRVGFAGGSGRTVWRALAALTSVLWLRVWTSPHRHAVGWAPGGGRVLSRCACGSGRVPPVSARREDAERRRQERLLAS